MAARKPMPNTVKKQAEYAIPLRRFFLIISAEIIAGIIIMGSINLTNNIDKNKCPNKEVPRIIDVKTKIAEITQKKKELGYLRKKWIIFSRNESLVLVSAILRK